MLERVGDADSAPAEPRPLIRSPANERAPALSPDGRWIAYVSDESGRDEVYVQAFGGSTTGRFTISTEGGREPVWARDGSELFYRTGDRLMSVPVELTDTFEAGAARELFRGDFDSDRMGTNQYYDVDLDGSRFIMSQPVGEGGPDHLHLVAGFARLLRDLDAR